MTAALELQDVVKRYGRRRALDGLSLSVPRGSIFGLVGSNGAGKTTALCSVMGLLRIRSGRIDLLGRGPFDPRRHAGIVSVLPQDAQLPGHATLDQVLTYYARLQGIPRRQVPAEIEKVLGQVRLLDRRKDRIRSLSHGMRRRAAIAQAFLGDPDLVLLDEPLNGLDPVEVANIRSQILTRRGGKTTVISSHILKEIEAVCDHVAFIEQGRLVRQDELHRLVRSRSVMTYSVEPGSVDVGAVAAELPDMRVSLSAAGDVLTVEFDAGEFTPAALNARVLPVLLRHGAGIGSVRPGRDLEKEYLEMKKQS